MYPEVCVTRGFAVVFFLFNDAAPTEIYTLSLHDALPISLRVRGTSMTHVGIEPGDLVVVKPQDSADDGDFVVARLADSTDPEGYVTLKRFYRRQDHIFLQSATADKDPIRLFPQAAAPGRADR